MLWVPYLDLGAFCVEFACFSCVCVGSLHVLWLPPAVQKHVCVAKLDTQIT